MPFFGAGFCIFQRVTCRGVFIFHIFMLKKQLFAYEKKMCSSEQKFVKDHETLKYMVGVQRGTVLPHGEKVPL